jgi:hypothetical protein
VSSIIVSPSQEKVLIATCIYLIKDVMHQKHSVGIVLGGPVQGIGKAIMVAFFRPMSDV